MEATSIDTGLEEYKPARQPPPSAALASSPFGARRYLPKRSPPCLRLRGEPPAQSFHLVESGVRVLGAGTRRNCIHRAIIIPG